MPDPRRFRLPEQIVPATIEPRPSAPPRLRATILNADGSLKCLMDADEADILLNVPEGGSWQLLDYSGDLKALFQAGTILSHSALDDEGVTFGGQAAIDAQQGLKEVTSDDDAS